MGIKALAFDVDGTLYPEAALWASGVGMFLRRPRLLAAFGAVRREIRELAGTEAYQRSPPSDGPEFRRFQARLVAERLGRPETEVAAMVERILYEEMPEAFSTIRPYPGLMPALDRLRSSGLRLAVLSDLPPARKLELLGLSGFFETVLCSEDSGFLKPAPEPYRMVCMVLGLPASELLYIGDSPERDLRGAAAAGMKAAIVSRRPVPGAALSFFDWDELAAFVEADRTVR
jgi:putative hydrolase of the HAD superfamily